MTVSTELFQAEYAKLVRKFVPEPPVSGSDWRDLEAIRQCSNPYYPTVWIGDKTGADAIQETCRSIQAIIQRGGLPLNTRTLQEVVELSGSSEIPLQIQRGFADWLAHLPCPTNLVKEYESFRTAVVNVIDWWLQRGRK